MRFACRSIEREAGKKALRIARVSPAASCGEGKEGHRNPIVQTGRNRWRQVVLLVQPESVEIETSQ
jgi:hypothetical protein